MIQCSFEEEVDLPGGGFRRTACINKAEILVTSDPCYGLCYFCAYNKLAKRVKELEADITIFSTKEEATKISMDIYGDPDILSSRSI